METRASPFIVGLFTLAVLFGALGFVYWLGAYGDKSGRETYRIVFSDEVTGLNRGGSVLFNGIKIGEVTQLGVAADDPQQVVATVMIDGNYPINVDTRAQLQYTGITGVAYIQLKPGAINAQPLREAWNIPGEAPIIYAERSTFQDLMEGSQSLLTKLDTIAGQVEKLVADNESSLTNTVRNIERFSGALAENSDQISSFMADASAAARRLNDVGARIEVLTDNVNEIVVAIDTDSVRAVVSDIRAFTETLAANRDRIDDVFSSVTAVMDRLQSFAVRLDDIGEEAARVVAAVDPERIERTVANVETFTDMLAANSDAVTQFMAEANAAAQRLNEVGAKVEALTDQATSVMAAVDPEEIRGIIAGVHTFTDTLAENSARITDFAINAGAAAERLNSLAGRLETLSEDVRRVVTAVDPEAVARSVANVESFTDGLAAKTETVQTFIDDAAAIAAQLKTTAQRVDTMLVRVDGMIDNDGGNFITEATLAAQEIRALATNLNSRLDVITADIQRYGSGGLREFQSFMSEGRRTLSNIERVINNLERNPAGFLTGGGSRVPEYSPGRRF